MENFKIEILRAYRIKMFFTRHALDQMNLPERMISEVEVKEIIEKGKIIEDYPEDKRGHSCLMKGATKEGRILHVHCAPRKDYLAIITAYPPNHLEWNHAFEKRKR